MQYGTALSNYLTLHTLVTYKDKQSEHVNQICKICIKLSQISLFNRLGFK